VDCAVAEYRKLRARLTALREALAAYVLGGHTVEECEAELRKPCNGSPFSLGVRALAADTRAQDGGS
jgi:hypothetical protein